MLTQYQVLESCVRWGVVAIYTNKTMSRNTASLAYGKFHTLQYVLQLPYSRQCKGLSIEELEDYCEDVAESIIKDNKDLQETIQNLDLETFQNKLK